VYSLLDEHGITLRGPIKFYQMGCPMVLNHFYLKYAEERQRILEEKTLRDCLQAAIEYKDFVLVSEIYKDNGGEQSKYPILAEVWERTQHILRSIQKQINGREEKDIAAFWIDSMDYSDLDNMKRHMRIALGHALRCRQSSKVCFPLRDFQMREKRLTIPIAL